MLFRSICVVIVVGAALMVATFSTDALVLLGGLAVAFGFQMWVPLAAVCYFPWLTREGVSWGLLAGILGVMLTESIGQSLFGGALPWGRWPWTMHSAFWGIFANLLVAIPVSYQTQNSRARAHRQTQRAIPRANRQAQRVIPPNTTRYTGAKHNE